MSDTGLGARTCIAENWLRMLKTYSGHQCEQRAYERKRLAVFPLPLVALVPLRNFLLLVGVVPVGPHCLLIVTYANTMRLWWKKELQCLTTGRPPSLACCPGGVGCRLALPLHQPAQRGKGGKAALAAVSLRFPAKSVIPCSKTKHYVFFKGVAKSSAASLVSWAVSFRSPQILPCPETTTSWAQW